MKPQEGLSFIHFKELCEQNSQAKYVSDCLFTMNNLDCLFNPGAVIPHDDMLRIYKIRLAIAIDNGRHGSAYISDFKQILENTERSQSDFVGILHLSSEDFSYIIFYDPHRQKILGILKTTEKGSLIDEENYNTEMINNGLSSGTEKYSKGKFVRNWK
jgi:hypothetical protein